MSNNIPFRYDIVGSFLRPQALKDARADYAAGKLSRGELTEVEDRLIADLIEKQRACGLKAVTDGEFRRRWWHLDFLVGLKGVTKLSLGDIKTFHGTEMKNAESYYVSGPVSFDSGHPFLEGFRFLKDHAGDCVAKQTIPGPNMLYLCGALLSKTYLEQSAYASVDALEADIASAYQDAIQAFYDAGCRYLQLDDTAWGLLLEQEADAVIGGFTARELLGRCADITRRALAKKPADMAITFHFCRGNFRSSWLYEGGYEAIARHLLAIEELDGFFLEYDTERAGSFEPLRHVKGQKVVLGLVTTKTPALEETEHLLERVREAARYVPLGQLCVSPQCGFASTEDGNSLTEEEQWAKIRLVVETGKQLESLK